jgi:hypothetical protein
LVEWVARLGAVTAHAVADRYDITSASARSRLAAARRDGALARANPLRCGPALYTPTAAGLRMAALRTLGPCHVSAANAAHLAACARVAAAFERCYPDHVVRSERELRRDERELAMPLASARMRSTGARDGLLHRPDLVLWPRAGAGLPVAVEVELTVKAPRRLEGICRAWARARCVSGVLYITAPEAGRAVERAVARVGGEDRIIVVPLTSVANETAPRACHAVDARPREPSQARRTLHQGGQSPSNGDTECPTSQSIASFSSGG